MLEVGALEVEASVDDVVLLVAEEVTDATAFVPRVVEEGTLADDALVDDADIDTEVLSDSAVKEEVLAIDEPTDEAVVEDKVLREEDVDEYSVDDGDFDDVIVDINVAGDEAFVVKAAEGSFVEVKDVE